MNTPINLIIDLSRACWRLYQASIIKNQYSEKKPYRIEKTRIVLAFAVVMLALGCQQNQPTDDPEIIKKILFDYFDGIKAKDLNKLNELTTKDFVLFEGGSVWNNDSLIAAINEHYKSFDPTYSFDNFEINVDSRIGNMRYYNHCDCIIDDTIKRSMDWVESATFVKVDGKWKMDFLHSSKRRE